MRQFLFGSKAGGSACDFAGNRRLSAGNQIVIVKIQMLAAGKEQASPPQTELKAGLELQHLFTPKPVRQCQLLGTPPSSSLLKKPADLFSKLLESHSPSPGSSFEEEQSESRSESPEQSDSADEEERCSSGNRRLLSSFHIRKRRRKNNQQLKFLKTEYQKNCHWDKQRISRIAKLTGLSESQVYKWCWDQRRKKEGGQLLERWRPGHHDDDLGPQVLSQFFE